MGFAADCFVCLVMLWLAEEEKCGEKSGVVGLF